MANAIVEEHGGSAVETVTETREARPLGFGVDPALVEAEAAADDSIDLDLSQALSSIDPDLDTWKENTVWTSEKVATTLDEQGKAALGDDAEWSEEQ